MLKKTLSLLLVCCMALSCLAGCGNSGAENPSASGETGQTSQTAAEKASQPVQTETTEEKAEKAAGNSVVSAEGIITADRNTFDTLSGYEEYLGEKVTLTEAPMLSEQVAAGIIPSLEDRLPSEPLVMLPLSTEKTIGQYGGELHVDNILKLGTLDDPLYGDLYNVIKGEYSYAEGIYYNFIDSMVISEDSTVYTFHIRDGLKWSDGAPCTTEEVDFWWNDLVKNEECTINAYSPVSDVVIVDGQTFEMHFPAAFNANDNLGAAMAEMFFYPKHYLSKYHPGYSSAEEVQKLVDESGLASWSDLIKDKCIFGNSNVYHAGRPSLMPYVCVEENESQAIYERNPYYFVVDAQGQQLPYIDRIVIDLTVEDTEVARLRVLNGDSDFYNTTGLDFMPTAIEAAESAGKVKTAMWTSDKTNQTTVNLNQNTQNEDLLPLFREKDFRFALSYAINRQEIIDLNYFGLLEPKQTSWSRNSKYYSEKANNVAVEYDPDKANELLDGLGLDKRDADGWRLLPNGKRLELNMAYPITTQFNVKDGELIMEYFKAVGIYTTLKGYETQVFSSMRGNCEYDVAVAYSWGTNEGAYVGCDDLGVTRAYGWWAPRWTKWYSTKGEDGEEPVPEVLEALKYYDMYKEATTEEERAECWKKITDLYAENLWTIGICDFAGYTVVYNSKLRNIPDEKKDYRHGDRARIATWYFGE